MNISDNNNGNGNDNDNDNVNNVNNKSFFVLGRRFPLPQSFNFIDHGWSFADN